MKIKLLSPRAVVPTLATPNSAAYDLYAAIEEPMLIFPGETVLIPTDIAMEIPEGYCGKIYPRSGLATKKGLRCANCVGVIDSDYRGNVCVALHNDSENTQRLIPQERIAQIAFEKVYLFKFEKVDELSETQRGAGGFGSTGTK